MSSPIFVIHGVANHDRSAFAGTVKELQQTAGHGWNLSPIFWGDLGADDEWVHLTIPRRRRRGEDMRDSGGVSADIDPIVTALVEGILGGSTDGVMAELQEDLRDGTDIADKAQVAAVSQGARYRLVADEYQLRDARADEALMEGVTSALAEHWQNTRWLARAYNSVLLGAIGVAIGGAVADRQEMQGSIDEELRGANLEDFVRRRLHEIDNIVGAAVGAAAGRLNTYVRSAAGPSAARFRGDVLVYQRRRGEIHQRIRQILAESGAHLGTRDNPVRVLAHSLGGVIVLDMVTSARPLWVSQLLTFGSQFSLFHAVDARGGLLKPLSAGLPVQLPSSLGGWTNLWEPMDVLAFLAGSMFRLHDGSIPEDVEVPHLASSGLWTHSAYWHLQTLTAVMSRTFR